MAHTHPDRQVRRHRADFLVHDFAGHPFQADLSRELAKRGHRVVHAFCGGVTTGQGDLDRRGDDPPWLVFRNVQSRHFDRYGVLSRTRSEAAYGLRLAWLTIRDRPRVVLSANTPLLAQTSLWAACRAVGSLRAYWLQDFLGRGIRSVLADRLGQAGRIVGSLFESLEQALLRRSDLIVAIAGSFEEVLSARGVRTPSVVIENWAPLREIGPRAKDNAWSRSTGLNDRGFALYAGTLGMKHDPNHLIALARRMVGTDFCLVVVSEGIGRDALAEVKAEEGLDHLVLLDFVPYTSLADLLGAADVCLVLLEESAGAFSVPSKVLSYLAAGRPIVASVPSENLAAATIVRSSAGMTTTPGQHEEFAEAVVELLSDSASRRRMAANGRAYAEQTFDVSRVADRLESAVLAAARGGLDARSGVHPDPRWSELEFTSRRDAELSD